MNTNDQTDGQESGSQPMAGATMSEGAKILNVEDARSFAIKAAQSLRDDKCSDVVVIDVGGRSPVTGFIVIGSGTSARQMRGSLGSIEEVAEECGTSAYHITEDGDAIWLLADFVDVVVHLFEPNARAHYDLEGLWFECPRVEVPASERSQTKPGLVNRQVDGEDAV
jgi:ribosome-associated protein